MKSLIAITLLVFALAACSPAKHDGLAAPVDAQKLEESSIAMCPQGQKFQVNSESLWLYGAPLPKPILFAVQRGGDRCADLHNVDHGGLDSWLNVTYSTDCVLNGSLWLTARLSNHDGDQVNFDLKSLEASENNWIHIFTSNRVGLQQLHSEIGLVVYSCR